MNVYDFDKTIYDGDSTLDFYFYCLRKHPSIIICLPKQLFGAIAYKLRLVSKVRFKEMFYSFLKKLKNVDGDILCFWDGHQRKIKDWYLRQREESDLIISASPEFLLREICERVGIQHLIASAVDKKTGCYTGNNCYGEEKVNRFSECYPGCKIKDFYSDSISDQPMADIAENSYLVRGCRLDPWKRSGI